MNNLDTVIVVVDNPHVDCAHRRDKQRGHRMNNNGQKWIRNERRLAIYLRDGLACAYCGASVEDGARLTLDHIAPRSEGGNNENGNLVTACRRCNTARGTRTVSEFCDAVAHYLAAPPSEVERYIDAQRIKAIDVAAARDLIESRGGFSRALYTS